MLSLFSQEFRLDPLSFGVAEKTETTGKFFLGFKESRLEFDYELSGEDEQGLNRITFTFTDKEGFRHTYVTKTLIEGDNSVVSLDIDNERTGDKIKIEVDIKQPKHVRMKIVKNGETVFGIEANVNPVDFSWDLAIQTLGKEYKLQGRLAIKGDFKVNINGDVVGPVDFNMLLKKDYSESKLELAHKNKK